MPSTVSSTVVWSHKTVPISQRRKPRQSVLSHFAQSHKNKYKVQQGLNPGLSQSRTWKNRRWSSEMSSLGWVMWAASPQVQAEAGSVIGGDSSVWCRHLDLGPRVVVIGGTRRFPRSVSKDLDVVVFRWALGICLFQKPILVCSQVWGPLAWMTSRAPFNTDFITCNAHLGGSIPSG